MAVYPEPLFDEITDHTKRSFLAAYAYCGRLTHAAKSAQCNWRMHYYWLKVDPLYKEKFAEAQAMAGDFLEEEAMRRAKDGISKAVYYQGEVVGEEIVYSDTLAIFLLKGAKPDKYRDNVKVETEITLKLEGALTQGIKRLEVLRGGHIDSQSA